ncbi:MAG: DUF1353 domain-containing protein [Melioribacteraceae bacterium]
MKCITYRGGYKYQIKETYTVQIEITPTVNINTEYIQLDTDGNLTLTKGYAWDGPSGPTIDTLTFMRGSLIHDALYQLMREEFLDHKFYRRTADVILRKICREDGMWFLRAWWVYAGVRLFADPAADPADKRPLTHAPKGCQS